MKPDGSSFRSILALLKQFGEVVLRLGAVFLVASLCSFLTINQPVLRVVYDALSNYWDFVAKLGHFWQATSPYFVEPLGRSVLALVSALGLGLLVAMPIGFLVGMRPQSRLSVTARALTYLGTMTPSFLLALLIMIFFVLYVLPRTGIRFIRIGSDVAAYDPRRMLPIAMTLMARPLAYFTTVIAAEVQEILASDYVRTARGKGLSQRQVLMYHAWPNVLPALLNAIPVALLFSISSLPIVEFVFNFPGIGQQLLVSIVSSPGPNVPRAPLVSFVLASLGAMYVLVVVLTDWLRYHVDPRTRQVKEE